MTIVNFQIGATANCCKVTLMHKIGFAIIKIAQFIVSRPLTISSIGPIKKLETLDKIQARLD